MPNPFQMVQPSGALNPQYSAYQNARGYLGQLANPLRQQYRGLRDQAKLDNKNTRNLYRNQMNNMSGLDRHLFQRQMPRRNDWQQPFLQQYGTQQQYLMNNPQYAQARNQFMNQWGPFLQQMAMPSSAPMMAGTLPHYPGTIAPGAPSYMTPAWLQGMRR